MSKLKLAVNSADHHQGNVNAAITLIEYGDFECPHCKLAHPLIKNLLKDKSGDLHFVYRHFPLRKVHPHAYMSAVASEAAGRQGKFWEMHDLIFENQDRLSRHQLLLLAGIVGVDPVQFENDSISEDILQKVEIDFDSGLRSGVNRTPTFFLNGSLLSSYDETYESLLNAFISESHLLQDQQVKSLHLF